MVAKCTKKDLAELLAEKHELTKKDANEIVNTVFDTICANLTKGVTTDIAGFGKFVVKERKERDGINPLTKEPIHISASKAPGFRAAKALKEAVSK